MPSRGRLIRRRPLSERLQDFLDPGDWALWLSEQLESEWIEQLQDYATAIGIGANVLFLFALANSSSRRDDGDVFGDFEGRFDSGWFSWFSRFVAYSLIAFSWINTIHTLLKRRAYRLFEQSLNFTPETPSARRVRVDSSPAVNNTPFSVINNMFSSILPEPPAARAHPQEGRDVWEISIWEPTPFGLRLICLFSPVHVSIYMMFLPTAPMDPTPSLTYFKTLFLVAIFSAQAIVLRSRFERQQIDKSIINKEVLNEYDTKFVHPSLNHVVRDVGIQTPPSKTRRKSGDHGMRDVGVGPSTPEVETYTPHTVINRGFHISPNPEYASQYDPDNLLKPEEALRMPRSHTTSHFDSDTPIAWRTPTIFSSAASSSANASGADFSSPLRPIAAQRQQQRQKSPVRRSTGTSAAGGEGGSLGVYTHAASPLRKTAVQNFVRPKGDVDRVRREGSPLKRISVPTDYGGGADGVVKRGGRSLEQRFRGL